jgi:hypothetical protein
VIDLKIRKNKERSNLEWQNRIERRMNKFREITYLELGKLCSSR